MTPDRPPVFRPPDEGDRRTFPWGSAVVAAGADATAGRYDFGVVTIDPGGSTPRHRHPFSLGIYVVEGRVRLNVGGGHSDRTLHPSGFAVIPAGVPHTLESIGGSPAKLAVLGVPGGWFEAIAAEDPSRFDLRTGDEADDGPDRPMGDVIIVGVDDGDVFDAAGDRYRFLATSDDTSGRFALWHAAVPPGGGPPPHRHLCEDEAFFILDGQMRFDAGDESFTADPGAFVGLPVRGRHQFHNDTDAPATLLMIVAPGGLDRMFRLNGRPIGDPSSTDIHPIDAEQIEALQTNGPDFGIVIEPE